ncbi:rRNA maturation RNase YbeY [Tropicibacter oceani]|uniref:Endoribonuclease YbeY n=1 Tax=Tropicibacter oceani TaxID=3058420 RepID=A0ABY8QND3_9RHOB|nr:rRNA maturation RNase YbeY [Tropicibacter oceani]WGW05463.1 rRNA maturation RNase YbeY [Tropicibacter oceani]
MLTDTIIEDARWDQAGLETLAEQAAQAVLRHLGIAEEDHEIAVLGCDDTRIAALNADFRGKPTPTNVLSWPSEDLSAEIPGENPLPPELPELGDIAIAFQTCEREAQEQGKPFADHVTHLVIHAVLHLLGYDHIRDADATLMEGIEVAILGKLGVPDPYRELDGPSGL